LDYAEEKNMAHKKSLFAAAAFALVSSASYAQTATKEVNIYTYREPELIKPLFEAFTKETGTKVNVIFAKDGLEKRIEAEGAASPADVLLTVDIARLTQAKELGITQPVKSAVLEKAISTNLRDSENHWFGLSMRGRVVYASKERVKQDTITYEELADPKWKGKICIRSGQHIYNNALFSAVYAKLGAAKAENWLNGLKANLARKPSGGDREVAKDIAAGICDIGLGNTYYMGLMINREGDKKVWADATKVILPTFVGGGTHVNISGAAVAKNAPNKEGAIKLIEWLSSDAAQKLYAETNFEYPVRSSIAVEKTVASWGTLKPDSLPLTEIAKNRKNAAELVDKVGFDN
jgi:iron(III) transport system substrate-binding protein